MVEVRRAAWGERSLTARRTIDVESGGGDRAEQLAFGSRNARALLASDSIGEVNKKWHKHVLHINFECHSYIWMYLQLHQARTLESHSP
jgi:hypothetical protein